MIGVAWSAEFKISRTIRILVGARGFLAKNVTEFDRESIVSSTPSRTIN